VHKQEPIIKVVWEMLQN